MCTIDRQLMCAHKWVKNYNEVWTQMTAKTVQWKCAQIIDKSQLPMHLVYLD